MADIIAGVEFTSYFSCVDMIEARDWGSGGGYFGVLSANFDSPDPDARALGEYTPKPSYFALQSLCSVFANGAEPTPLPLYFLPEHSPGILGNDLDWSSVIKGEFTKPNGSSALIYWYPADLMTIEYEGTVTLQIVTDKPDFHLIDLYDGAVYELPDSMVTDQGGCYLIKFLPIRDYPMILTVGQFADVSPISS